MSTTTTRPEPQGMTTTPRADPAKLVVSWQHPASRTTSPIALLLRSADGFEFRYLRQAASVEDFRPLLGFPDFEREYRSNELFPLFSQRALDPTRGDFGRYVAELGLTVEATPWEQIVRSGGDSAGDTLKVSPMPEYRDGFWYCVSPVAGIEYLMTKTVTFLGSECGPYSSAEIDGILRAVSVGDQVSLGHEVDNEHSPAATLVASVAGRPFGYLPDWLAHMIFPFVKGESSVAYVDQIEKVESKWYVRLLIQLDGGRSAEEPATLGGDWATFV